MEPYRTITIDTTESTNTYAKNLKETDAETPTLIITDNQTQGRGQRGNSWESEPGMNLTFSLVVHPTWMSPSHQFELSMLVSVALVDTLRKYVDEPEKIAVKWPNDIYYTDSKLAGILIENSVAQNSIEKSVIGIGINVNQTVFTSDAPNPISLKNITGIDVDRDALLKNVVESIVDMIDSYADDPEVDELSYLYNNMLWRKDGRYYPWRDEATGKEFEAMLDKVEPDGNLCLIDRDGNLHKYLFKEVSALQV